MQFVVSEQAATNTAMIHRCDCRKAQGQDRLSMYIRLHGPFDKQEQAVKAAARTGRKTIRFCANCRP